MNVSILRRHLIPLVAISMLTGLSSNGAVAQNCTATAITPYLNANNSGWQQTSSTTLASGNTLTFGPQPTSGGSWSWTGCGTSGSVREQTKTITSSCTATATYRNSCGASRTQNFTITVAYPDCTSATSDPDGDGWGWENNRSCKVAASKYNIAQSLVNPTADASAKRLHSYLIAQFGKKIISGQTADNVDFDYIKKVTGKTPLIRNYDMQHYSPMYSYNWANGGHAFGPDAGERSAENAINWYNSNAGKPIIAFQWHWHSPSGGRVGTNTFYTDSTVFDVAKGVTPGTQEYYEIIRDIDAIAVQLKKLRAAGVPVLWRPLHEAGGTWFWWSAKGGNNYIKLWDIVYDRLTNYHQIHNLIWVWTGNDAAWYPGNNKVDILGIDSYPGNNNYTANKAEFDKIYALSGGKKLLAMTENGPIPDINASLNNGAPWNYFMSWNDVWIGNNDKHLIDIYSNPNVITLENY